MSLAVGEIVMRTDPRLGIDRRFGHHVGVGSPVFDRTDRPIVGEDLTVNSLDDNSRYCGTSRPGPDIIKQEFLHLIDRKPHLWHRCSRFGRQTALVKRQVLGIRGKTVLWSKRNLRLSGRFADLRRESACFIARHDGPHAIPVSLDSDLSQGSASRIVAHHCQHESFQFRFHDHIEGRLYRIETPSSTVGSKMRGVRAEVLDPQLARHPRLTSKLRLSTSA